MQGNVNISDSTITTNLSFRQLVLMNMRALTNFPYIEKDFDALTDYELLCLVVKFLNDVIANQNEQNDSITRMYESFLALQTYVNTTKDTLEDAFNNLDDYVRNYFDNLDVQDEIDHKLDEMLEDGVLEQIIEQFLQLTSLICFDNVADMKASVNLANGSYAKTLGYYSINDGGSGLYKIRTITNDDVVDEATIIALNNNTLIAELVTNVIYPEVYGAKGDGITDDTNAITKAFNSEKTVYLTKNYKVGSINITGKKLDIKCSGKITGNLLNFSGCTGYVEIKGESTGTDNFVTYTNSDNLTIRGTYKNAAKNAVVVTDCNNVDVSVNIFDCGLSGLIVAGYQENPKGANIHDCYVENSGRTSGYSNAIYVNSTDATYFYENVNISNCICKNSGCCGIFVSADYANVVNCCVDTTGTITGPNANGMRIHDCKYVNVTNCEIKSSARFGIEINKASYINVTNCIAKNCINAGYHALYDTTEAGRYYGEEANTNVTFNTCMSIDNSQYGNNAYPGFLVTSYRNISLINCMVNSTGAIKHSTGVLGNSPVNLTIVGCIFTNSQSNSGTNVNPTVGHFVDGNGGHMNIGGTYRASIGNFGISTERQVSINAGSNLESVIKFISALCVYLESYGILTTTSS